MLGVGSADGPSIGWLRGRGKQVSLDIDPRGLDAGGVCGSALALPFADESFDLVAAFDVIEHCDPEADVLSELTRVLTPRGRLTAVGAGLRVGLDALRRAQRPLPSLYPPPRRGGDPCCGPDGRSSDVCVHVDLSDLCRRSPSYPVT
jgi:SAM-dependent methyltransferase